MNVNFREKTITGLEYQVDTILNIFIDKRINKVQVIFESLLYRTIKYATLLDMLN